jgi:putative heme-binding domain-containing protein
VNEAFAAHSAEHDRLFDQVRRKGRLQLRTQLVGLGRNAKVRVEASAPFDVTIGAKPVKGQPARAESYAAEFALDPVGEPEPLSINLETGLAGTPALHASYSTDSDPTWRPLPFGSLLLPWAPPHQAPPPLPEEKTELAGGDFERGRALFFGERLKCGTCHRVRGDGGVIGPDLSNLVHRDAASVLRDIKDPNATINPDYVAYNVRLRDGGDITGFVRAQSGDSLRVVGADGKELQVRREEVTDMRPSAVSLMPAGLLDGLMEAQVRDLLTFLLHEPPARSRAQVEAVLRQDGNEEADSKRQPRPLTIVLAASKQDHGPGQHDYPAWQKKWMTLLGQLPGVSVVEAWEWPTDEQFRAADVMVFYFWNHNWSAERLRQLDDYQARGGGLVIFHSATIADKEPETLAERIGLASQSGPTKYLHSPFVLNFVAPASHPITRGFKQLNLLDEPYWPMIGDTNRIEILATAEMEGEPRPLLWTFQKGKGRVFASIPGHYSWTFDDPLFRVLALRGVAWAAGEPVRRFEKP